MFSLFSLRKICSCAAHIMHRYILSACGCPGRTSTIKYSVRYSIWNTVLRRFYTVLSSNFALNYYITRFPECQQLFPYKHIYALLHKKSPAVRTYTDLIRTYLIRLTSVSTFVHTAYFFSPCSNNIRIPCTSWSFSLLSFLSYFSYISYLFCMKLWYYNTPTFPICQLEIRFLKGYLFKNA